MTAQLRRLLPDALRVEMSVRRGADALAATGDAAATVAAIVDDVRRRGDVAVREWTARLDGVSPTEDVVPPEVLRRAWEELDSDLRSALVVAHRRILAFHTAQRPTAIRAAPGLELRPIPVGAAGCYVPGGRAAYPSSVLMTVVPARVAGVERVVVVTPPSPTGTAAPVTLAAAHLAGADEVRLVGGAQAIAALAYGTESLQPVDVVVGPGNLYVTLAKRSVVGLVGIDGLAGPSEIVVVASDGAHPDHVAADLVSQLEHDPLAWAVCITDSRALAEEVERAFVATATRAARAGIVAEAAGEHAIVTVVPDMDAALYLVDAIAPEHLELVGEAAEALADRVRTAAAIFVGDASPVAIGDYVAGPNHTLPTGGAARFGGPLSVLHFLRWSSVTCLRGEDFAAIAPAACALAEAEGLLGHAEALRLRMPGVGVGVRSATP